MRLATLFISAIAISSQAETRTFKIEPSHATIEFQLRHYIGKVIGHFSNVHGTLRLDLDNPANSSVVASCPTRTVDTANHVRDGHLRTELFEVDKFPEATFRSTQVVRTGESQADVTGDLTLHGVTHPIVLHVALLGQSKNSQGVDITRWRATGAPLSRRAFGLKWSPGVESVSGIGDEVILSISCDAREGE